MNSSTRLRPFPLAAVQGPVGGADERVTVGRVVGDGGDAEVAVTGWFDLRQAEAGDRRPDLSATTTAWSRPGVRQQEEELSPPYAADEVALAQRRAQHGGHGGQEPRRRGCARRRR
jgi:hypothetical protein